MFGSPQQTDKQLQLMNKMKLKTDSERSCRSLNFARIYFHNKDFKTAEKHVLEYLEKRPNSSEGYKILAQIQEAFGNTDKALDYYRKSLEVCRGQNQVENMDSSFNKSLSNLSSSTLNSSFNCQQHKTNKTPEVEKSPNVLAYNDNLLRKVLSQQETLMETHKSLIEIMKKNSEVVTNMQRQLISINSSIETLNQSQNELKESFYDYLSQYQETQENQLSSTHLENNISLSQLLPTNESAWHCQQCDYINPHPSAICGHCSSPNPAMPPFNFDKVSPVIGSSEGFKFSLTSNNSFENRNNLDCNFVNQNQFVQSSIPAPVFNFGNLSLATEKQASAVGEGKVNKPLSELFKPPEGSWECNECYVRNESDKSACVSCGSANPNASNVVSTSNKTNNESNMFKTSNFSPQNEALKLGMQTQSEKFKFGVPDQTENMKFGNNQNMFSNSSTTFSFANAVKQSDPSFQFNLNSNPESKSDFKFGLSQDSTFNFQLPLVANEEKIQRSPNKSFSESVSSEKDENNSSLNLETVESSNADNIYFQPVIPLPPKVDVKTGEEEEEVLSSFRAKLFRYNNAEWKERGTGDVKILRNNKTGIIRILMRRDTVLKVCLNHRITSDIQLEEKPDKKTFQWSIVDYSEDEPKAEVFAIRFKNPEIASEFIVSFKNAQKMNNDKCQSSSINEIGTEVEIVYERRPQSKEILEKVQRLKLPLNFFDYENAQPCPGCRGCKDEDENRNEPSLLKQFLTNQSENKEDASNENLFSSLLANSNVTKTNWNTQAKPSWILETPTPIFEKQDANDDEVANNQDIYFKPLIPLPDLIEVKTGEEDEKAIFSQRAKLYRFESNTKEWKERGVGEFKILKHNINSRFRLLMRRDQIHKIACNHYISKTMTMEPLSTSETSVVWSANDYSEGKETFEKFAIKFKNKDILNEFKNAFAKCQSELKQLSNDELSNQESDIHT